MQAYELDEIEARRAAEVVSRYLEFQRSADLSTGLYVLPAGGVDPQQPHGEDEVYVVMAGRATIRVGTEERAVRAGSVVFVALAWSIASTTSSMSPAGRRGVRASPRGPERARLRRPDRDRSEPARSNRPRAGTIEPAEGERPPESARSNRPRANGRTNQPSARPTASVSACARTVASPVSSCRKNTNTCCPSSRNGAMRFAQASISSDA